MDALLGARGLLDEPDAAGVGGSGRQFQARSGKFDEMERLLADKPARSFFEKEWLPKLLQRFAEQVAPASST